MVEESAKPDSLVPRGGPSWLRLTRAVRLATDFRSMMLGAVALVLLQGGWSALDLLFPASTALTPEFDAELTVSVADLSRQGVGITWELVRSAGWRLTAPVRVLMNPLMACLTPGTSGGALPHTFLGILWTIAVLGIIGGAISRMVLVRIGRGHRLGLLGALRFTGKFWPSLLLPPLCSLLAVSLCALVCSGFGLLYRLPAVIGGPLGGALLIFPLTAGLVMAIVLFDLVAGWSLMHASVAAEAEDTLDALSRSFSYVNQRLGKFAGFIVIAWIVGIPGLLFVETLVEVVIHLTHWGLSLSAPPATLVGLRSTGAAVEAGARAFVPFQHFWVGVARLLAQGWIYGYYWTASSIVYLLLRHDVDGTPWSEIKLADQPLEKEWVALRSTVDPSTSEELAPVVSDPAPR